MAEPLTGHGVISVNEAAELAGSRTRKRREAFRRKLQELHEQHGDVLFSYSTSTPIKKNAKLWTTWDVLRRFMPTVFGGDSDASGLDVMELRWEVAELRRRLGALEKKVTPK